VDEIGRATILEFATHCLKLGQNGKTICNKLVVICQLPKQYGRTKILNASDWPSFVQRLTMSANGSNAPTIQKPGANAGRLCNPLLTESVFMVHPRPLCFAARREAGIGFASTQIVQGFGGV
jgi:hypothetical protein